MVESVATVAAALVVGLERARGDAFKGVAACCCSGIDCNFSFDGLDCGIKGGGNGTGGFVRETLLQLVENHLESVGTRRLLLVCVPPLLEADATPMSFISTKASHPLYTLPWL